MLILGIYPSMADMGEDITKLMDKLPEELGKALGMDEKTWSSIIGFYSTYYGIYIILLVGIYTMSTGTTIISKEEKDGTSEFLLTKPISRKSVFWTKMASLFTLSMIIYVIQTICAVVGLMAFGNTIDWGGFTIMHIHGLVLILFFTALGVLLSFFFTPKKNFMGMVVGIIFGSYFLNAISKTAESIEWIGYISGFHYLEFTPTDPNYELNIWATIVFPILAILIMIFAYHTFKKKDING
jgi:ABC-2 type transport system permease protein